MNAPAIITKEDHTTVLGYPPMLPVELALRVGSVREICEAHGLDKEDFRQLLDNPVFRADLERAKELVRKEGMSFKLRAMMQSEALLDTSWGMIHNPNTPATVRADLIKFTWRVAGLDASKDQALGGAGGGGGLSIHINLG